MKKTRLTFSSLSIEKSARPDSRSLGDRPGRAPTHSHPHGERKMGGPARNAMHHATGGEKKSGPKNSTFQYVKKGFGPRHGSGSGRGKPKTETKIPPVEAGVIRVIPLGG